MPLKSIDQHNNEVRAAREAAKKTGVACPSCGDELKWADQQFLTHPPKRRAVCACGWSGYLE